MSLGLIRSTDVRIAGLVLTALGIALLVVGQRGGVRRPWAVVGGGALLATWGAALLWVSLGIQVDGSPAASWASVRGVFGSMFDSWSWVIVTGIAAGFVWTAVLALVGRGPLGVGLTVAAGAGALLAALVLGLLDASITPL